MQFSFRHAALIASVLLGVLATVSLTLYLNGGDKGKPPGDAQSQTHQEGENVLGNYTVNLTNKALEGCIDPIIGRDEEIQTHSASANTITYDDRR